MVVYLHRYNQLSSIPASLANCTKIDEFNIEGNNVSELPVSTFFFQAFLSLLQKLCLIINFSASNLFSLVFHCNIILVPLSYPKLFYKFSYP